jgi:hypothetical protein
VNTFLPLGWDKKNTARSKSDTIHREVERIDEETLVPSGCGPFSTWAFRLETNFLSERILLAV